MSIRRIKIVKYIVVHCADTDPKKPYPFEACLRDHIYNRGWETIGYHYYITTDGVIHKGRELFQEGAHVYGYNPVSIGVCYEGGKGGDTRTLAQKTSLVRCLKSLKFLFPDATIVGHHDLDPKKSCPNFDAQAEYSYINNNL